MASWDVDRDLATQVINIQNEVITPKTAPAAKPPARKPWRTLPLIGFSIGAAVFLVPPRNVIGGAGMVGLLVGKGGLWGNVIRMSPPLNIGKADVEEAVRILDESLSAVEKR